MEYAVELAREAGVSSYALFHHEGRADDEVDQILAHAPGPGRGDPDVVPACEGLQVDLPGSPEGVKRPPRTQGP